MGALGSAILICLIVMTKVGLDRANMSSCYHTDNTTGTGIQLGHKNRYQVLVAKLKFRLDRPDISHLFYSCYSQGKSKNNDRTCRPIDPMSICRKVANSVQLLYVLLVGLLLNNCVQWTADFRWLSLHYVWLYASASMFWFTSKKYVHNCTYIFFLHQFFLLDKTDQKESKLFFFLL